jgi:hypothetical protein
MNPESLTTFHNLVSRFPFGTQVTMLTNPHTKGIVYGYAVRPSGSLLEVAWGDNNSRYHYDFELKILAQP